MGSVPLLIAAPLIAFPPPLPSFVFLLGLVLDSQKMTQRRRAQVGFVLVMVPTIAAFIWLTINQAHYDRKSTGKLDW